jgi:hypothetical protein
MCLSGNHQLRMKVLVMRDYTDEASAHDECKHHKSEIYVNLNNKQGMLLADEAQTIADAHVGTAFMQKVWSILHMTPNYFFGIET